MICLQGHTTGMHHSIAVDREDETKSIKEKEAKKDNDFALGCMRRGVAALCVEQRAFGERTEPGRNSCYLPTMRALPHSLS